MREAYLDFYTRSLQPDAVGGPYNKRMIVEQKEHNEIMEKIMSGKEPMPQLEKDPLESKEADVAVDLRQFSGYTLKSQSTYIHRDKDRVAVSQGAKNRILDLQKKFRARKQSGASNDPDTADRKDSHISEEDVSEETAPDFMDHAESQEKSPEEPATAEEKPEAAVAAATDAKAEEAPATAKVEEAKPTAELVDAPPTENEALGDQ